MFKDFSFIKFPQGIFNDARLKLTAWYLLIIMTISFSFSGVIYLDVNRELTRIAHFQKTRIEGLVKGYPVSFSIPVAPDMDAINDARLRFITSLGLINLSIFILAGVGGYFLAGLTLEPIAKVMSDQKKFVSNASHELRTPLTSLMTEIEVALRDKNLDLFGAKRMLKSNLEEVKKMSNLSNYLLTLSKIQDGKMNTKFIRVNLSEIAQKAIKKVEPMAATKNINIITKFKDNTVVANPESIEELMTILLDNAIKYSFKDKSISLIINKHGFSISDKGIGISKEDLPHIFERFYRADSSRHKEKTDGYGLGLSIAKSIVDMHKGEIKVLSQVGKGTTFTVLL